MDTMAGKFLVNKKGETVLADTVLGDINLILYYFSASWCPASNNFTKKLEEIHKVAKERKMKTEIIYVSSDNSLPEMMACFQEVHGPWFAVPYGDTTLDELRIKYGVTGIPVLIVVQRDGYVVTRDGRREVEKLGVNTLVTWT